LFQTNYFAESYATISAQFMTEFLNMFGTNP